MNTTFPRLSFASKLTSEPEKEAATAIALGLAAGACTQALFWRTGIGLNFFLWSGFAAVSCLALFRRSRVTRVAGCAVVACLLVGSAVARLASLWTLSVAVPLDLVLLASLPMLLAGEVTLASLAGLPRHAVRAAARTPRAAAEVARLPARALAEGHRSRLRAAVLGLAVGLPTALIFWQLLSADDAFRALGARLVDHCREGVLFGAWTLATGAGYLVTHVTHRSAPATDIADGSSGATRTAPFRAPAPRVVSDEAAANAPSAASRRWPERLEPTTWGFVVGQVALVFAVFVAANLRSMFGGVAWVKRSSDTYASYLHSGFAVLLVATLLSVGLVAAGHRLMKGRTSDPHAPVPGGRMIAGLEAALVGLTAVTVASCGQRLRIYEDAYGASHLRLGVAFIEMAILGLLALTLVKILRRSWRGYAGSSLSWAVVTAVLASQFNADVYVGQRNLDRALEGKPLDESYLGSLSPDARSLLTHPFVRANPRLSAFLTERYCSRTGRDWRSARGPLGACRP